MVNFLIPSRKPLALPLRKKHGQDISTQSAMIVFVPMKINPKWIPGPQLIPKKVNGPIGLRCDQDIAEREIEFDEQVSVLKRMKGLNMRVRNF
jgi:hypothetical protein